MIRERALLSQFNLALKILEFAQLDIDQIINNGTEHVS